MKLKSALIALPAMLIALQANAECPADFPANKPVVPNGATASEADMLAAKKAVESFVAEGEAYLACSNLITVLHNRKVEKLNRAAAAFNEEAARFNDRVQVAGR